ncbi:MAG: HAD-IA family hydrolase [Planctomycetota bacterium]|nr:HAD-IA family hydrolase [Planctomycetota bacterium]
MKVVVFDVVGTLVEPWPRVSRAYVEAGRRHGVELVEDVVADRFAAAWRRQEAIDAEAVPAFATSRQREIERWREIVEDVFAQVPVSEAIFADLWQHFARPEAWRPLPEGVQMVEEVKRAGGEVALASNFDERLVEIARTVKPLMLADHVFASSELGWRKPAAEFFREVERRLDRQPEELVLVGDDPRLDIAAARKAGWEARSITPAPV